MKNMTKKTKYRQIYELLRERVLQMSPGERLSSIRSLQKSYQVSLATLNRALKLLIEEGIIESVRAQGLFRSVDSDKAVRKTVILILPGQDEPLFRRIILSCYGALEARNMRMQFMIHKLAPEAEAEVVIRAFNEKPAGILYMPTLASSELKRFLQEGCGNLPLVQINREIGAPEVSFVGTQCYEASLRATERLIECGHRRIGLIVPKNNAFILDQQERIAGFHAALKQTGLSWRRDYEIVYDPADRRLVSGVIELLSMADRPTAFFATNSSYLPEFFRKAEFCGLKIPDDLSVTCVDIADTFRELPVPIDRMEQPIANICSRAVEILDEMIISRDFQPRRELLGGTLVSGNSCGPPPIQESMPFAKSFFISPNNRKKEKENVSKEISFKEPENQFYSY